MGLQLTLSPPNPAVPQVSPPAPYSRVSQLYICKDLSLTACASQGEGHIEARLVEGPMVTQIPSCPADSSDNSTEHQGGPRRFERVVRTTPSLN